MLQTCASRFAYRRHTEIRFSKRSNRITINPSKVPGNFPKFAIFSHTQHNNFSSRKGFSLLDSIKDYFNREDEIEDEPLQKAPKPLELSHNQLRWTCSEEQFGWKDTSDPSLQASNLPIGQAKFIQALEFGLNMKGKGYNIAVTAPSSASMDNLVEKILKEMPKSPDKRLYDHLYVHSFKNTDVPRYIALHAGRGKEFKRDMEHMIIDIRDNVRQILESDSVLAQKRQLEALYTKQQNAIISELDKHVAKENFVIIQTQGTNAVQLQILPIFEQKTVPFHQLDRLLEAGKLTEDEIKRITDTHTKLLEELELDMKKIRSLTKEYTSKNQQLEKESVKPIIEDLIQDIKSKYKNESSALHEYLDEVKENILANIDRFKASSTEQPALFSGIQQPTDFVEYKVNVVVDNSDTKSPPIVVERNPTFKNLFGTIEDKTIGPTGGVWSQDFTRIKAGSLLKANGGYLVISALDIASYPAVWDTLTRTLRNNMLEITAGERLFITSALKPQAIELDVKVILISDYELHDVLSETHHFNQIFKVTAQYDYETNINSTVINQYAQLVKHTCVEDNLLHFSKSGVAAIVEHAVSLTEHSEKAVTTTNEICDLIREANFWAQKSNKLLVDREAVEKAISEKINRTNLHAIKEMEQILRGSLLLSTSGETVGQVNSLAVTRYAGYEHGVADRVTAKTSCSGKTEVINIDKEADLSGEVHTKGVLILTSYLHSKYTRYHPPSLDATVCFEQSYAGVDGDSASTAEIYAILSSLSGLPVNQSYAVTGSVNQHGEVQPIGGVNLKIEAFFDICKKRGLTGKQGVVIPALNVPNLMLRKDIVEAVRAGTFHIYPIKTVDEGSQILMGVRAGTLDEETEEFEPGTINYLVQQELDRYRRAAIDKEDEEHNKS